MEGPGTPLSNCDGQSRGMRRRIRAIVREAVRKFLGDNGLFLASGLAFNILLYCFPLTLLLVSALGFALGASDQALAQVQRTLARLIPRSQRIIVDTLAGVVEHRGLLGGAGFAAFFLFGTFLFGSVRHALNTLFEAPQLRPFVHGVAIDLVVMVGSGALFVIAMGIASLLALARTFGARVPLLEPLVSPGVTVAGHVLGFGFTIVFFWVLYRFLPARTLRGRALLVGACSGAVLLQLAKWGFAWYVAFAQDQIAWYGALGGIIFFIFWLYYASLVFILGATIAWCYEQAGQTEPLRAAPPASA